MRWEERIGRRVRLRDLHTLLAVSQTGSMAKAAAYLSVTQPAISKAMAEMEYAFGVRLLERTPNGVEPTVYGRALLKWGTAVFDDLRQAVQEIEFLADPTAGDVRIGATEPIVEGLLPAAIEPLLLRRPRIRIQVTRAESVMEQYREVRDRSVDFIIGRIQTDATGDDLHTEILFDDPPFVVTGPGNRWARRRKIKLAELLNEPWSLPHPDGFAGAGIAEAFRVLGLPLPSLGVTCNSIQMHHALLRSGRFLAVYPGSLLHFSADRFPVKVLPIKWPIRAAPVGIVRLKNRLISPVAQLVLDQIRLVAKPLTDPRRWS